jgi:hypothetical protein
VTPSRFSLGEAQFELSWLAPIERGFAALCLAGKLNGPQALVGLDWGPDGACRLRVRDGGVFPAHSRRPHSRVMEGAAATPVRRSLFLTTLFLLTLGAGCCAS